MVNGPFMEVELGAFYRRCTSPLHSSKEGRVSSGVTNHHHSCVDDSDDVSSDTSMDEETHPKGNFRSFPSNKDSPTQVVSESKTNSDRDSIGSPQTLPEQNIRRSSRPSKLPSSLNDFVVEGKVKYGLEKVVNFFLNNTLLKN
ncbi:hypothetical protein Tco_0218450 [Tanacetum coccineum]